MSLLCNSLHRQGPATRLSSALVLRCQAFNARVKCRGARRIERASPTGQLQICCAMKWLVRERQLSAGIDFWYVSLIRCVLPSAGFAGLRTRSGLGPSGHLWASGPRVGKTYRKHDDRLCQRTRRTWRSLPQPSLLSAPLVYPTLWPGKAVLLRCLCTAMSWPGSLLSCCDPGHIPKDTLDSLLHV